MMELLRLGTHCFWHFIGVAALLTIVVGWPIQCVYGIIHKAIRATTIRKIGYPPPHCDGDGDAYTDKDDD